MKSIGPFEHIVLEAVAGLDEETYGTRFLDRASTLAGDDVNVGSVYVTLELPPDRLPHFHIDLLCVLNGPANRKPVGEVRRRRLRLREQP